MPGGIPGPLGAVAFAGVKLGGYYLAGLVLKKAYVPILASALKIAGARLGVGILLSPVVIFGGAMIANNWPEKVINEWPIVYAWLVILRLAVWAGMIRIFAGPQIGHRLKWTAYTLVGTGWSCLLDVLGIALAFITPGHISIC